MSMPSQKQKSLALEHICYEIRRLLTWYALRIPAGNLPQSVINDRIELILIHVRNLLDFFEVSRATKAIRPSLARPDDIVSEDFAFPAQKIPIDPKVKGRIDKEVAHLTYTRCGLSPEEKQWRFDDIVPPLLVVSLSFLRWVLRSTPKKFEPDALGAVSLAEADLSQYLAAPRPAERPMQS